jgi:hypothetical protein
MQPAVARDEEAERLIHVAARLPEGRS